MSLHNIALSTALVLGLSGLATAQTPAAPPVPDRGYYRQVGYPQGSPAYQAPATGDMAYQRGFQDGLAEGEKDRHKNREFRPTHNGKYHDAPGYDDSYGDKEHWKRVYQTGFAAGYYQGFYGVAPSPYPAAQAPVNVSPAVSNPAYQKGFQDGVAGGQEDRSTGREYRALTTSNYQHTPGYDSSYGDKDQYKEFYRQGYAAGYQQGFGANAAAAPPVPANSAEPAYTNSQAYQLGYQDGVADGRDDRQSGRTYRATTTDKYQDAPGYSKTLGDKDQYKELYRQGYVSGYQAAFNGSLQ
jgi:hypothetical protein